MTTNFYKSYFAYCIHKSNAIFMTFVMPELFPIMSSKCCHIAPEPRFQTINEKLEYGPLFQKSTLLGDCRFLMSSPNSSASFLGQFKSVFNSLKTRMSQLAATYSVLNRLYWDVDWCLTLKLAGIYTEDDCDWLRNAFEYYQEPPGTMPVSVTHQSLPNGTIQFFL